MNRATTIAAIAAAALTAGASAQIATFTFSDLNGAFDSTTREFTANASADTSGDVTRLVSPAGSAQYQAGFAGMSSADVSLSLTLSNITAASADAVGSFTITDDNGDTLTGDMNGQFTPFGFSITYDGLLSNVMFNDVTSDGSFDGPSSGAFSNAFNGAPFDGAIVQLFFDFGGFFANDFSDTPILVDGLVVPAPASLALVGLGGLAATRRRR